MECSDFIDNLQNIVNEYMKTSSYSVGISDLISDSNTQLEITKIITEQKEQVQKIMEQVHLGLFDNETAATNLSEFETRVNNTLNDATNKTGKVGRKSLDKITGSYDRRVGVKGVAQHIADDFVFRQQNIDGKRIPYGFESRTLPHYNKFDDSPEARGFIENSYISGLTVGELFFHAMAGRTGLIDTAIKTSQTGYIQRRLIKALEDVTIAYMTARNNMGKIIQFKYGDDGFESTKVENQFIPLVGMSIEDIYLHYDIIGINGEPTSSLNNIYTKTTITRLNRQGENREEV
jgi:DNA-directed RNA polymerase II subunit RPB1